MLFIIYHPEKHVMWNDAGINIEWPIEDEPILSTKDAVFLRQSPEEGFS